MRVADLAQQRVGEQVVPALGERAPGLDLHPVLAHELLVGRALEERVRLDLVDRRGDLVVVDQVDEPVGVEVATRRSPWSGPRRRAPASRATGCSSRRTAGGSGTGRRGPGRVAAATSSNARLVLSSPASWTHSLVVTNSSSRGMPLFAIARPTASSLPYAAAVSMWPVAGGEGVGDGLLGLLGGDLVDAEAEDRHLDAVVQGDCLHDLSFSLVANDDQRTPDAAVLAVPAEPGTGSPPISGRCRAAGGRRPAGCCGIGRTSASTRRRVRRLAPVVRDLSRCDAPRWDRRDRTRAQRSSHPAVHTTLAATSVVQWTPSSTRENATTPTISGQTVSARARTALRWTRSTVSAVAVPKTTTAVAVCPEGNDQPCVPTRRRGSGGRGRSTSALVAVTASASPAQPARTATRSCVATRRRQARTATTTASPSAATHEPAKVSVAIQRSSAGVLWATTQAVIRRSSDTTAAERVTPSPATTSSPNIAAQLAARSAAGPPALRSSGGPAGDRGGSTTGSANGSTDVSMAGTAEAERPGHYRRSARPRRPPARLVQAFRPQLPVGGGQTREPARLRTVRQPRHDEAPRGAPRGPRVPGARPPGVIPGG